jgi:L-threonylcarbamoyladenylate synthase
MKQYFIQDIDKVITELKAGKVGVLPTDTLYGLHGLAFNIKALEKIHILKGRPNDKPFIILISKIDDLKLFNIKITAETRKTLQNIWPNQVSVILNNQAFRIPKNEFILKILKGTGPLISTSANLTGEKPAKSMQEAKKYFGNKIDFCVDAGELESMPSTLIKIENNQLEILREGVVKREELKI